MDKNKTIIINSPEMINTFPDEYHLNELSNGKDYFTSKLPGLFKQLVKNFGKLCILGKDYYVTVAHDNKHWSNEAADILLNIWKPNLVNDTKNKEHLRILILDFIQAGLNDTCVKSIAKLFSDSINDETDFEGDHIIKTTSLSILEDDSYSFTETAEKYIPLMRDILYHIITKILKPIPSEYVYGKEYCDEVRREIKRNISTYICQQLELDYESDND